MLLDLTYGPAGVLYRIAFRKSTTNNNTNNNYSNHHRSTSKPITPTSSSKILPENNFSIRDKYNSTNDNTICNSKGDNQSYEQRPKTDKSFLLYPSQNVADTDTDNVTAAGMHTHRRAQTDSDTVFLEQRRGNFNNNSGNHNNGQQIMMLSSIHSESYEDGLAAPFNKPTDKTDHTTLANRPHFSDEIQNNSGVGLSGGRGARAGWSRDPSFSVSTPVLSSASPRRGGGEASSGRLGIAFESGSRGAGERRGTGGEWRGGADAEAAEPYFPPPSRMNTNYNTTNIYNYSNMNNNYSGGNGSHGHGRGHGSSSNNGNLGRYGNNIRSFSYSISSSSSTPLTLSASHSRASSDVDPVLHPYVK